MDPLIKYSCALLAAVYCRCSTPQSSMLWSPKVSLWLQLYLCHMVGIDVQRVLGTKTWPFLRSAF